MECYSYGCGSACSASPGRGFLTKAEKIQMLKDYQKQLENEAKGVAEKIKSIESKKDE